MREERKIIITMNPKQLRNLADDMERQFPKKKIGDSCFIDFLGHSQNLQVCLHADQEWFVKNSEAETEKVFDVVVSEFEKAIKHLLNAHSELINHNGLKDHEFIDELQQTIDYLITTVKYLKSK